MVGYLGYDHSMSVGDGVDKRIKVVSRKVGVLRLDEDDRGGVVPREVDVERERVVEVREGDTILRPERLADDDLVDVIKLVPILVPVVIKLTSELMYSCRKAPPLSNKAPPLATYPMSCWSLTSGSNFGPPGIAMLRAFAVKKDFKSKR